MINTPAEVSEVIETVNKCRAVDGEQGRKTFAVTALSELLFRMIRILDRTPAPDDGKAEAQVRAIVRAAVWPVSDVCHTPIPPAPLVPSLIPPESPHPNGDRAFRPREYPSRVAARDAHAHRQLTPSERLDLDRWKGLVTRAHMALPNVDDHENKLQPGDPLADEQGPIDLADMVRVQMHVADLERSFDKARHIGNESVRNEIRLVLSQARDVLWWLVQPRKNGPQRMFHADVEAELVAAIKGVPEYPELVKLSKRIGFDDQGRKCPLHLITVARYIEAVGVAFRRELDRHTDTQRKLTAFETERQSVRRFLGL